MRHRGVTLTETLVACLLLSSLISLVSATLVRLGRQRLQTEHARIALDELSNQLDHLTTLSANELSSAVDSLQLMSTAAQRLPDARLTARLTPGPAASRLAVSIAWKNGPATPMRPLTLVAWVAQGEGRVTP